MPPLSSAATAAHTAFWGGRFGRFTLHPELTAEKLVAFFTKRGESTGELPLDVDKDDVEAWTQEWLIRAKDAEVSAEGDRNAVVSYLKARAAAGTPGATPTDQAQRVVDALAASGVTIPTSAHSAVSKVLRRGQKEAARSEAASTLGVYIIFFGLAPSESDEAWFGNQALRVSAAAGGADGDDSESEDEMATINMRHTPTAIKILSKDAATPTLERVLGKGGDAFVDYVDAVDRALVAANLPGAAQRFRQVCEIPVKKHKFDERMQRAYLLRYFFSDYMGRGLPKLVAKTSLSIVAASRAAGGAPVQGARGSSSPLAEPATLLSPGLLGGGAEAQAQVAMGQLAMLMGAVSGAGASGVLPGFEWQGGGAGQPGGGGGGGGGGKGAAGGGGEHYTMVQGARDKWEFCNWCKTWHRNANLSCESFIKQRQAHIKALLAAKAAEEAKKG